MRTITRSTFAMTMVQNGMFYYILLFIVCGPVAIFIAIKTFAFVGFVIAFGLPLYLLYLITKSSLKKVELVWDTSRSKIFQSLNNVDYWNVDSGGGLGVDVGAKQISFVDASNYKKIQEPFVFNVDRLQNIRWVDPGRAEFYNPGGVMTGYRTDLNNQIEKEKAAMKTGLFLHVDDLHRPILFFRTSYAEAERLGFLIGKLMEGTLEPTAEPMFYPKLPE